MRDVAFGVAGVVGLAAVLAIVVSGIRRASGDVEEGVSQRVRIGQLEAEAAGAKTEADRLRQDLDRRKEELKKERGAADALRKDAAGAKAEAGKLRRELDSSRAEAKKEKAAADALRKKLAEREKATKAGP